MPRATKSSPVDVEVGAKVRLHRMALGMSQTDLANHLGVTFQQVQKYEKGFNRISASKLHKAAEVLGLPISDLFGTPSQPPGTEGSRASNEIVQFLSTKEGLLLNRAFVQLTDPKVRRRLIDLIRVLGDGEMAD
jgi:transcriptional regulator with XRE-family HTH domain